MKNKEQLLKEYFAAREKAFNLEVEHQIAVWEADKLHDEYVSLLRAEKEAAAND